MPRLAKLVLIISSNIPSKVAAPAAISFCECKKL